MMRIKILLLLTALCGAPAALAAPLSHSLPRGEGQLLADPEREGTGLPAPIGGSFDRPRRGQDGAGAADVGAAEISMLLALAAACAAAPIVFLRRVVTVRTQALMAEVILRSEREKALEQEKRFVENVVESLPVLFYLHDGRRFLRWNSAFRKAMALADAELAAINPRYLIHQDDRALTSRKRSEIFERGEAQWEARVLTGDGVREHYMTGKRMELDGAVYAVGTATDVTDRKAAERALRESERRFAEMLENLRLIAIMIDTRDRITFCNDYLLELTGWRRPEVLGRNWFDMFYPDPEESRRTFRRAIGHDTPCLHRERTILTRSGVRRVISWNSTLLRNPQGEEIGVASIGQDITDRRQYENALQHISTGVSTATGAAFFHSLVSHLARALEVEDAMIAELDRSQGRMRTVAICAGGEILENFSFDLAGGPGEAIVAGEPVLIGGGLSSLYPKISFFREHALESYAAVPLTDAGGELLGMLAVLDRAPFPNSDLVVAMLGVFAGRAAAEMKRTRAEQALKESEEKYRLLFDRMLNGYAVCEVVCDAAGLPVDYRFLEVNASFETLTGLSRQELIGKRVLELMPQTEPFWIEAFGAVALTEEPDQFEAHWRALAKWLKVAVYSPQPGQFAATFLDITKHKLAEQALVESEEHVREVFAQGDDGLILFQMDSFDIVDANPAALSLFGTTKEELRALRPWELISRVDFCRLIRMLTRGEVAGGFQLDRGTCYRADGSSFIVGVRGKILTLRNEYVVLCSVRDITSKVRLEDEMKATQAKLIQANKMTSLGMLVSGVAHEINNPNNFISVNSLMLSDVWRDAEPILKSFREENGDFELGGLPFSEMEIVVPRLLSGISEGASRITSIVGNMRKFVRKEEGGASGAIDINRSIDSAASLLWHHIHRHTDSFEMNLAEGLPAARGSAQQIEQVIINLIMNALQALPGKDFGVEVRSGIDPDSGMVMVSVIDEGYGMKKKVQKHLTEPFFSTKIDKGGTGLGLYISSSIIKEHEGILSFESAPGKGTTATIRLPVAELAG